MTQYTSPASSPISEAGKVPYDLYLLAALESSIDAVRFRFDGVANDLAQEVPVGATRSMAAVIASMRQREEALLDRLAERTPTPATSPFFRDTNAFVDLGKYLTMRQDLLARLRLFGAAGWGQTPGDGAPIRELLLGLVAEDAAAINELSEVRQALIGGSTPGTAGRMPAQHG